VNSQITLAALVQRRKVYVIVTNYLEKPGMVSLTAQQATSEVNKYNLHFTVHVLPFSVMSVFVLLYVSQ